MKIAVAIREGIEKNNISIEQFFTYAKKYGFPCSFLGGGDFDLLVTFGGDGTTLRYAKQYLSKPIVAVNMGHIGFLAQIKPTVDDYKAFFERLSSDKYSIMQRTMLNVSVGQSNYDALNDVLICSANRGRTVRITAFLDNVEIKEYNCDGLIVSTPTGSTAHSLSCGGSAITVGAKVFSLTPVAGINNTVPVIYPDISKLSLRFNQEQTSIYVDGELINSADGKIEVFKSQKTAKFLLVDDSFFAKLRTKNID